MSETALEQFMQRRQERAATPRSFIFEGETLIVKAGVAPEVAMKLARTRRALLEHTLRATEAARLEKEIPDAPFTDEELLAVGDETALACLAPESREAWERIRSVDAANPLIWTDIFFLCDHFLARAAEPVPTVPPADSSAGRANTNGSSKDASRSPAKKRRA